MDRAPETRSQHATGGPVPAVRARRTVAGTVAEREVLGPLEGLGIVLEALDEVGETRQAAQAQAVLADPQAGIHAQRINELMKTFLETRHFPEDELREVIGHTPFEVITGIILGSLIALLVHWFLPISPGTAC